MQNLLLNKSVNENYKDFLTSFTLSLYEVYPIRMVKFNNKQKQQKWLTQVIRVSSENKRRLHKLSKTCKQESFLIYFRKYKQIFKKVIAQAKKCCNSNYIMNSNNKNKAMWEVVKDELGLEAREKIDLEIDFSGKVTSDPLEIAEYSNEEYSNIKEILNVPNTHCSNQNYIISNYTTLQDDSIKLKNFSFTSKNEVKTAILNLNNSNACGWDEIPTKLLKWSVDIISEILANLINQSLFEGIFPDLLKFSEIKPIHKKYSKKM